ncbi:MAG: ribbon-helix-helix protein, CopG family [Dehalococcoidia bacterium]
MARRRMSKEEEAALVAEIESSQNDDKAWDFDNPKKIDRGPTPTAVLSVRLPLDQFNAVKAEAARRRIPLSDLVREAIESYAGAAGTRLQVGAATRRVEFYNSGGRTAITWRSSPEMMSDSGLDPVTA